jgi:hypothetical protein
MTQETSSGFPTTAGAFQPTCAAPADFACAFLAKVNPAGSALLYATYLGTQSVGNAVVVDSSQNVYISGALTAPGQAFPEVNSVTGFPSCGASQGFVSEINSVGSQTFSTCLGSPLQNLALDGSGNMYVAGVGYMGLPLKNPIQSNPTSAFIAAMNPNASSLLFSSYIGAAQQSQNQTESEVLADVGVDTAGNIYAAGYQPSSASSLFPPFPVFDALQPVPGGQTQCSTNPCYPGSNAILLKIAPTDAAAAALSPALLTFPPEAVGIASAPLSITVFDMGSANLTVSNATVTGDFSIQNGCTNVAAAGGNCAMQVTFTPTILGTRTGTLTITDSSEGSPRTVQLTGQGAQASATPSPTSLSFTDQQPGTTSSAQTVTLNNSGAIALQVSSVRVSGPFAETNNCGSSVPANQACTLGLTFSPTTAGAATGTLTITDSAPGSPQTGSLTGTGGTPSLGLAVASGGSASATVTAGATATYALSIGGAGMAGTASLTCSGAPVGATCSVPATVPLTATTASALNVSVSAASRSNVWFFPTGTTPWLWALAILGCLVLRKAASAQQFPRLRWRLAPLLALAFCACGGGSASTPTPTPNANGTPAGAYTIVVTAKSGATSQTLNLTLTVQ